MIKRVLKFSTYSVASFLWLTLITIAGTGSAKAQNEETNQSDTDSVASFSYYDENIDGGESTQPDKPEKKPYVRIVMPMDTITELITYTDIVEVKDYKGEDIYFDSMYIRAKRWINTKWGAGDNPKKEKENMKLYKEDVLYEKFKTTLKVPLMVRYNKYSSSQNGELQFTLILRFKDGKYKYYISNLVHTMPPTSSSKDINYTYMEFYMKSDRNVVNYDRMLRGADAAIKSFIKEMYTVIRGPKLRNEEDEDDW